MVTTERRLERVEDAPSGSARALAPPAALRVDGGHATPRTPATTVLRALATSAVLAAVLVVTVPSDAATNSITVPLRGLRNNAGQVGCLLFASGNGFPSSPERAVVRQFVPIASKSATCVFENIASGSYAIAAIHDENGNGKLDQNFLAIPTEGYGASRDARGTMGPPKWEDAVFRYAGGAVQVPVVIHY